MRFDMTKQKAKDILLNGVGTRVRTLRQRNNLTVREFSQRARLSPRFINQLETGEGNISIARLASVAEALGQSLPDLLPPDEQDRSLRAQTWRLLSQCSDEDWQALHQWLEKRQGNQPARQFIALIGIRGAGKSTVGPLLAKRLKMKRLELLTDAELHVLASDIKHATGREIDLVELRRDDDAKRHAINLVNFPGDAPSDESSNTSEKDIPF